MTPEQTPHPMESWLRRYAEKRRQEAGPPFDLHSADKERLLAEVRRVYQTPSSKRRAWWAFWMLPAFPRMAYAAALVVALGVATYFLWLSHPQGRGTTPHLMAKQDATDRQPLKPAPEVTLASGHALEQRTAEKKKDADTAPPPAPMERATEPILAARSVPVTPGVRTTEPTQATKETESKLEEKAARSVETGPARYAVRAEGAGDRRMTEEQLASKTAGERKVDSVSAPLPAAAPPPALAMRGAPSPVKPTDTAGTRRTPPQPAEVRQTTLPPQTNTLPGPKAAQSLAEFYLAQQTLSQDRPLNLSFSRGRESTTAQVDSALFQAMISRPDGEKVVAKQQLRVVPPAGEAADVSRDDRGVRYIVSDPANSNSQPVVFYLRVTNDIVYLVDGDGVVYEGRFNKVVALPASRNQQRTTEKAGARELLMSSPEKRTAPEAGRVTTVQATRQFELIGEHPRLQKKVIFSGQWPPQTNGILRLQMRIGEGPVQTLLVKPAEN